jgi:RRXRR protein
MRYLPVLSATGERLMPCHAARARQLIRNGRAIKKHDRGMVYLVLTERTTGETQPKALGIDPGSKKEAIRFSLKSTHF